MKLMTIGFTKTSAEKFFTRLKQSGTQRVLDVRLNNISQLAGFAKKNDLSYFLKALCDIEYVHLPQLAPTQEMLDNYRAGAGNWPRYEKAFISLLASRKVEQSLPRSLLSDGCLLCSEATPHQCHRRLVAEYLQTRWVMWRSSTCSELNQRCREILHVEQAGGICRHSNAPNAAAPCIDARSAGTQQHRTREPSLGWRLV